MNGLQVLSWLVEDAERHATEFYNNSYSYNLSIEDKLLELNSRRPLNLPDHLFNILKHVNSKTTPTEEMELISFLRELFGNDITFISLILNYMFPEKYFFYRTSMIENEIFAGFKFFCDHIEEFNFSFSKIGEGKHSFDNYIELNNSLRSFANSIWPDLKDLKEIQQRIHFFLYQGLGNLFLTLNDYNQYWIMATGERSFAPLDTESEVTWSGRKEMQQGDLVFMYRQTPRKAITDLFEVYELPWFDPYGGWTGFWVPLKKIASIKDITMVEMKHDEVLKHWSFVKTSSQGVSTAPIPYFAYNRLLELIDSDIRKKFDLEPEETGPINDSGEYPSYSTEEEFEDRVIVPLIKRWGFKHQRQYPCGFVIGSQHHTCQIDCLVRDSSNDDFTLFENKIRIVNKKELDRAVLQAKSYALQIGLGNFIVASPEGYWIYQLDKNREALVAQIAYDNVDQIQNIKSIISKLAS